MADVNPNMVWMLLGTPKYECGLSRPPPGLELLAWLLPVWRLGAFVLVVANNMIVVFDINFRTYGVSSTQEAPGKFVDGLSVLATLRDMAAAEGSFAVCNQSSA